MILTADEIVKQHAAGRITITPFSPAAVNPNSYNYRLGHKLGVFDTSVIDPQVPAKVKTITIPPEGYVLKPNKLYLGHTLEEIGSQDYVVSLIGRSSLGRLGLYLQITADLGQLGRAHAWTLELEVVQPLRIYPGMRIGQVSFWKPSGKVDRTYSGGYTQYNIPRHSKLHDKVA